MATRIGHGTVRTTMEVYARSSDNADREAANLLQELFGVAFGPEQQADVQKSTFDNG
jgi:hypothetical protein